MDVSIPPYLDKSVDDSIQAGLYPASRSGWKLHWKSPMDVGGANNVFIFSDTILPNDASAHLVNGTGSLNASGLPALLATLPPTDTVWEIPSSFFHGAQGHAIRSDTAFKFSVWARYNSGDAAQPVKGRLFLGDEMPPLPPAIVDSVGQTSATLFFDRPSDQTSVVDTLKNGPITNITVKWWPAKYVDDSTGKVSSISVSPDQLKDTSIKKFRLKMDGLKYFTSYWFTLIVTDLVGLKGSSTPIHFITRDSLPPAPPTGLFATSNTISWSPATDSFLRPSVPADTPNYNIRSYKISINNTPVDSIDSVSNFGRNTIWPPEGTPTRFAWDGQRWHWEWPNFRPGNRYTVTVSARDLSGNDALLPPSLDVTKPPVSDLLCPTGYVPVSGTSTLAAYCIEEREHRTGSVVQKGVTWQQALGVCNAAGADLCSETQWVRACESSPYSDSTVFTFGSLEAGTVEFDTLLWLYNVCHLGTGDSTFFTDSASDPRCVSAWGVFDLPGGVAEWTRDVYNTNPGSTGQRDPNSLAWLDTSDLTGKADLGTIHGGSWLKLDQPERTLPSARCRERNYPAFSGIFDTLPNRTTRRHPNPNGTSNGVGFRCCKVPGS